MIFQSLTSKQKAGEYIGGQCQGTSFTDVQSCKPCKTCANGTWAKQLCSGVDSEDTTICEPCIMSCPNTTHYYLKGDCILEQRTCELCEPPCDPLLFETVRECGNNLNRICKARTLCGEQCPPGYYTNGQCIDGAAVCIKCRCLFFCPFFPFTLDVLFLNNIL